MKDKLLKAKQRAIALALVGTVALTSSGCSAREKADKDNLPSSYVVQLTEEESAKEKAVLRRVFGRFPRRIDAPEELNYNYVLNMTGEQRLVALVGEHTFTNEVKPFDGKQAMSRAHFYGDNAEFVIPKYFKVADDNIAKYQFFYCFTTEVTYKVFKDQDGNYFIERTLNYKLKDNNNRADVYKLFGDGMYLKLAYFVIPNEDNLLDSDITEIYRHQSGILSDSEEVLSKNSYVDFESCPATEDEINNLRKDQPRVLKLS